MVEGAYLFSFLNDEVLEMFDTKNDIAAKTRSTVCDLLNQHLANAIDLHAQTKQAHWNVRGTSFYSLHLLFDKVHQDVGTYVDLIAERIGQLGGYAHGRVQDASSDSQLDPYPADIVDGMDHVQALSSALAAFAGYARKAIKKCDDLGDDVTSDMFTNIAKGTDSWVWMVEAHQQSSEAHRGSASMKAKVKMVSGKR